MESLSSVKNHCSLFKMWKDFLEEFSVSKAEPAFYQHVTDKLLAELIQQEFPLTPPGNQDKNQCDGYA